MRFSFRRAPHLQPWAKRLFGVSLRRLLPPLHRELFSFCGDVAVFYDHHPTFSNLTVACIYRAVSSIIRHRCYLPARSLLSPLSLLPYFPILSLQRILLASVGAGRLRGRRSERSNHAGSRSIAPFCSGATITRCRFTELISGAADQSTRNRWSWLRVSWWWNVRLSIEKSLLLCSS